MSVHHGGDRDRWVVRWREAGRQRVRRFADEAAARRFDAQVASPPAQPAAERGHGGVYAYETTDGRAGGTCSGSQMAG